MDESLSIIVRPTPGAVVFDNYEQMKNAAKLKEMRQMNNTRITPVANNTEKKETYREQMGRHNKAMKYGFYLEAIMIDYAMMEDRLRSVLYHVGYLKNRRSNDAIKRSKPYFAMFVQQYMRESENESLGVTNISGKIKIIRSMLLWTSNVNGGYQDDKYLSSLKNRCEELDIGGLLDTLDDIEAWCMYRNEIVHALLNKNASCVYDGLK